ADQIESLRRSVRYLMAVEQVKTKAKQHNLTDEQKGQLREREATEKAAAESAFLKLYTEVWLPRAEGGGIGIEPVAVGGRPLQTTLNEKKEAMIHERVMELVTTVQPRVFSTLTPGKIIELFKLGEGKPPKMGARTSEIVEGFYSFLGFTRLTASAVIRKAIARGVQEGAFGYIAGTVPEIGAEGKYQVLLAKVRFAAGVAEDEIDLESGFIMMPQAIPQPATATAPGPDVTPPTATATAPPAGAPAPGVTPFPPPGAPPQTVVEIAFSADRNQLFTAWNAVANLADLAGKVSVTVRAESEKGFDRSKLQNGVIEPLKEADLIE
ncbi:MAG: ATP-binding protein, partial [Gammaproteobacteria bacterium]